MKRTIDLTLFALILSQTALYAGKEYYVSPKGDDSNPGTLEKPFATLISARDAVRKNNDGTKDAPNVIYLRQGIYRLKSTFELNERDNCTTYRPYQREKVSIVGSVAVPISAVREVKNPRILNRLPSGRTAPVYGVDLQKLGIQDFGEIGPRGFRRPYIPAPLELMIDTTPLNVARYPNKGQEGIKVGKIIKRGSVTRNGQKPIDGGTFHYSDERINRWTEGKDIWISGVFGPPYADSTVKIKSIDTEKKLITTEHPHMYGFSSHDKKHKYRTYYALNLLEELDTPGEFFADKSTGYLFFIYPEEIKANAQTQYEISILKDPMVAIEGACHVKLQGITFENTRGIGVYIERGESNTLENCTLRNIGIVAVCIGKGSTHDHLYRHGFTGKSLSRDLGSWHEHIYQNTAFNREGGKNNGIRHCKIYNIGAGGISLGGGDRKTLEPAGNYVADSHIHHINRWGKTYKAAINIDGVGNKIQHNHIHHCTGNAIYLHGNDHLIEFNHIHHAVLESGDMGAYYMGRDPSEYGNVFQYNFMHDNGNDTAKNHGVFGVHLDDYASGLIVKGNIFYNVGHETGVNMGYHTFINNIFVDNENAVKAHSGIRAGANPEKFHRWTRGRLGKKRLREDVDITKPPYSTKYPDLFKLYNDPPNARRCSKVWYNVSVRSGSLNKSPRPYENPTGHNAKNNYETDEDPGFVDPKNLNFQLKKDSIIYKKIPEFKTIPFEKIGPRSQKE